MYKIWILGLLGKLILHKYIIPNILYLRDKYLSLHVHRNFANQYKEGSCKLYQNWL